MGAGGYLTRFVIVAFVVACQIVLGYRVVQGLKTGVLHASVRGGHDFISRKERPLSFWFWLACLSAGVLLGAPFVLYSLLMES